MSKQKENRLKGDTLSTNNESSKTLISPHLTRNVRLASWSIECRPEPLSLLDALSIRNRIISKPSAVGKNLLAI
jgi:hypothetical protein